jgi:hypothetical protein
VEPLRRQLYDNEGQISLDAFDTKTKRAVWHGQITDTINPKSPIRNGFRPRWTSCWNTSRVTKLGFATAALRTR